MDTKTRRRSRPSSEPHSSTTSSAAYAGSTDGVAPGSALQRLLDGDDRVKRAPRRKVEAADCDDQGRPISEAELRLIKRRQTNKESARRVKQLKQAEVVQLRCEVKDLVAANARRLQELQDVEDHCRRLEGDLEHYQQLHEAATRTIECLQRAAGHSSSQTHQLVVPDVDSQQAMQPHTPQFPDMQSEAASVTETSKARAGRVAPAVPALRASASVRQLALNCPLADMEPWTLPLSEPYEFLSEPGQHGLPPLGSLALVMPSADCAQATSMRAAEQLQLPDRCLDALFADCLPGQLR